MLPINVASSIGPVAYRYPLDYMISGKGSGNQELSKQTLGGLHKCVIFLPAAQCLPARLRSKCRGEISPNTLITLVYRADCCVVRRAPRSSPSQQLTGHVNSHDSQYQCGQPLLQFGIVAAIPITSPMIQNQSTC